MEGEWHARRLAELTDNFDGMRVPVKEADRRPGSFPYYGASGGVDHVDRFLSSADSLLARTLECRRESRTLVCLRDALLPKLISGELRIRDAERVVQEGLP